ncbi:MAG: extracellular solute-binding protein [Candidatus Fimimonas sp.]
MKKLTAILLSVLLVLGCVAALAACKNPTDNGETVELRILENDTAKKEGYLDYLLSEFNKKYADQNVKAVDANMDEYSDLEQDGPYGYGPDVLYQANDVLMKYVDGHHIMPIDVEKLDNYTQIPQNAWNAYKVQYNGRDVYCGVPVNVQQPLLYYRKDKLPENWKVDWDKNNNDVPDMVEFWTETYRYSKLIRETDKTKFGFALQLNNEYFNSGFLFTYGGYVFGKNNTDDTDIGLSKGNAKLGGKIIWDLAGVMDEKCLDDSFTVGRELMLANGTIFATICTPDMTSSFVKEMVNQYKSEGLSQQQAEEKTAENLVIAGLPKLPANGDITTQQDVNQADLWLEHKTMGGINGYGISSYTKHKEWAVKFVEFATSKEMVTKRAEMLGIVPARGDALESATNVAKITFDNLDSGVLVVMPSISSVRQIWTPIASGFKQIATDGCGKKTFQMADIQTILETIDSNIYKAIHTFS